MSFFLQSEFDKIKAALETEYDDLKTIFTSPNGSGFTVANYEKFKLDVVQGIEVTAAQLEAGALAVAQEIEKGLPLAIAIVNDAQLVEAVVPAVTPVVAGMQVALAAAQALDTALLSSGNADTSTLQRAITTIADLAKSVGSWGSNAIAAVKAAA